jgi:uncharacterized protein
MPVQISIKVQPNAGRNEVVGSSGSVWKIKIAAAPDKGKANKELIDFLSDKLNIKKAQISILRGQTSHNKVLLIDGLNEGEVEARMMGK